MINAMNIRMSMILKKVAAGFSLVETVLALAVMGLSLTVLLGLLPHGLEMSRKAGVAAGESRVVTDLIAELSQSDWANLNAYNNQRFQYDDQGVRVSSQTGGAGAGGSKEATAFVALVEMPVGANIPGSAITPSNLKRVVIKIASTQRDNYDFTDDGAAYSTVTTLLARRD